MIFDKFLNKFRYIIKNYYFKRSYEYLKLKTLPDYTNFRFCVINWTFREDHLSISGCPPKKIMSDLP